MQKTFKAWLTGRQLEWMGDRPELEGKTYQVQVTVLDSTQNADAPSRGQQMVKVLEKIATTEAFQDTDPVLWQKEVRYGNF